MNNNQPFHMVDIRPWPLTCSIGILVFITGLSQIFCLAKINLLSFGRFLIIFTCFIWWRDITRERTKIGSHTNNVLKGLRWGIILFIASEILFFFSFFWAFFHSRLAPNIELGSQWPPLGILPFKCEEVPLINTVILLRSGATITWRHHRLLNNAWNNTSKRLILTILLGLTFTLLQLIEYWEATFIIRDSIYGTTFFVTTGFHGLHVIIGTTILIVIFIRNIYLHFSSKHHLGFEAAAWYWHFVDVVWLFLFTFIYWWGY